MLQFCDKYLLLTAYSVSSLDYCRDNTIDFTLSLSMFCQVES